MPPQYARPLTVAQRDFLKSLRLRPTTSTSTSTTQSSDSSVSDKQGWYTDAEIQVIREELEGRWVTLTIHTNAIALRNRSTASFYVPMYEPRLHGPDAPQPVFSASDAKEKDSPNADDDTAAANQWVTVRKQKTKAPLVETLRTSKSTTTSFVVDAGSDGISHRPCQPFEGFIAFRLRVTGRCWPGRTVDPWNTTSDVRNRAEEMKLTAKTLALSCAGFEVYGHVRVLPSLRRRIALAHRLFSFANMFRICVSDGSLTRTEIDMLRSMQVALSLSDEECLYALNTRCSITLADLRAFAGPSLDKFLPIETLSKEDESKQLTTSTATTAESPYALPAPRAWNKALAVIASSGATMTTQPTLLPPISPSMDEFYSLEVNRIAKLVTDRMKVLPWGNRFMNVSSTDIRVYKVANVELAYNPVNFAHFSFFCKLLLSERRSANGANIQEVFMGVSSSPVFAGYRPPSATSVTAADENEILCHGFRRECTGFHQGRTSNMSYPFGKGVMFCVNPLYFADPAMCFVSVGNSQTTSNPSPMLQHLPFATKKFPLLRDDSGKKITSPLKGCRIVLALLAAGDTCIGNSSYTLPPVKPALFTQDSKMGDRHFDSMVDYGHNSPEKTAGPSVPASTKATGQTTNVGPFVSINQPYHYVAHNDFQAFPYAFVDIVECTGVRNLQTVDTTGRPIDFSKPSDNRVSQSPFYINNQPISLSTWAKPSSPNHSNQSTNPSVAPPTSSSSTKATISTPVSFASSTPRINATTTGSTSTFTTASTAPTTPTPSATKSATSASNGSADSSCVIV